MAIQSGLDPVIALREKLFPEVAPPIQLPEPSLKLNLESRANSQERMFKHIHQSCVLHRENFWKSSQIKHLCLLDAYIGMARLQNPLGTYMAARSMLEFNAFLHHVLIELRGATTESSDSWLDVGRKFFSGIVRARFATSRADHRALLEGEGCEKGNIVPWPVGTCMQGLKLEADFADAGKRYGDLCDFVHHNLGSATTANAGSAEANVAYSHGGGMLLMPKQGPITQYEYPVPIKATIAVENTAAGVLQDAEGCIRWLNQLPGSPFSSSLVVAMTGTPLGMTRLSPSRSNSRSFGHVSRNDPCPCGSGKKFKRCCLQ